MVHAKSILKQKYAHLQPNTIKDPAKEQVWNELARLFVQRFQEIHGIPFDSLAGLQTFQLLEKTKPIPPQVQDPRARSRE